MATIIYNAIIFKGPGGLLFNNAEGNICHLAETDNGIDAPEEKIIRNKALMKKTLNRN